MIFDRESPPGAWEREWDRRSHTTTEYQVEISELRDRIRSYLKHIKELEDMVEILSGKVIVLERQINQWGNNDGS